MKKYISFMLVVVFAVVSALGTPSVVAAKANNVCTIDVSTHTPVIGESVQFTIQSEATGQATFDWGDGSDQEQASRDHKQSWHTFYYVGNPVVIAWVRDGQQTIVCRVYLVVSGIVSDNEDLDSGMGGGMDIPEDIGETVQQTTGSSSSDVDSNTTTVQGNDNIAPVVNGDNNVVKITVEQIQNLAAVESAVEPAKPLTFGQKFWLPWKTFWRGIVIILTGWFDLNIP